MLTVGQLIKMLKSYPKNARVTTEQGLDITHLSTCGNDQLIISPNKPIGTCTRTGENVYPTDTPGYSAYCPALDEDLYGHEFEVKQ